MNKVKIVYKFKRKPDHLYYVDGEGNLCETKGYRNKHTIWERIQMIWIDWFYR